VLDLSLSVHGPFTLRVPIHIKSLKENQV
jgi:hypothetical protein